MSSLSTSLEKANIRLDELSQKLSSEETLNLTGLPLGAFALALSKAIRSPQTKAHSEPFVVIPPDLESAERIKSSLLFFLGEENKDTFEKQILIFPPLDTSPFQEIAPDRRASMKRLSTLFHLQAGLPWLCCLIPAETLPRKVLPTEMMQKCSRAITAETELDRDALFQTLVEAGYLRVPIAEDPGTFSVRGNLIDIYSPHEPYPARIELDDWLVLSIRFFDPETQKTVSETPEVKVPPVRETILGSEEIARGKTTIRDLCDSVNWPTLKTKALLEEIESGRTPLGIENYLPGFYPALGSLFDYFPQSTFVFFDADKVCKNIQSTLEKAQTDQQNKLQSGTPSFDFSAYFLSEEKITARLEKAGLKSIFPFFVEGQADEYEGALAQHVHSNAPFLLNLAALDQKPLQAALKNHRATLTKEQALLPLKTQTNHWLSESMRVIFTARTFTQAERMQTILKGYGIHFENKPKHFDLPDLAQQKLGTCTLTVGNLGGGFELGTEALVFVTEEEIFGKQSGPQRKKKKQTSKQAFLEDLRELKQGDFVVHTDHGVGQYLGLEQKTIAQNAFEKAQGLEPLRLEVLVIEYAGSDKLFVPVTKLHLIQKFAAKDGHKPKIDKLGGQSFSKTKSKVRKAVRQMAEELLKLYANRAASSRPPLPAASSAYTEFEATFPFEETPDQATAIDDVLGDLVQERPMDRIVCGDVGFGKTEVALRAAFRVAMEGKQVVLLCPTTVLAQQHFLTFKKRIADFPLRIEVISRFVDRKKQSEILADLKTGNVDILVGTHRVLSKDIHFKDLGLLIVDEEQRFGVTHKERIKQLRNEVDVLTLSATPIPRTLQMAIGGLRDLSLITTPPVDRRAVRTLVSRWDDQVIKEAIQRELSRSGQVFFVYNRIEGLYERANRLQQLVPDARIAVGHGQMKEHALEEVMTDFVEGQYDVLCSTAIIESGLDIPRANTMLIDGANLFGLSQLYQLRGRVGRSKERAYCYLITPSQNQMTEEARERIMALERFTQLGSGFQIASLDMEIRGAGDVLGAEQSGYATQVGFDLFIQMLQEAVADLKGEPLTHEVDTEITIDLEHYIPDSFIEDIGLRLSFYKKLSSASSAEEAQQLGVEMEDRFGDPPTPVQNLIAIMTLKPQLRDFRILGCEANRKRVTFHLREDTPLDPTKVLEAVRLPRSPWKLTPDMKLIRYFDEEDPGNTIARIEETLEDIQSFVKDDT